MGGAPPGGYPNLGINQLARQLAPGGPFKPHSDVRARAGGILGQRAGMQAALGMRPPAPLGQGRVGSTRNVSDLFRRLPRLPR